MARGISPNILKYALLALTALCLVLCNEAQAQIGYPGGGYPLPGQYPYPGRTPYPGGTPYPGTGVPFPGGKPNPTGTAGQPLANFRGKLKTMDSKSLSLEMDDYRTVEFRLNSKTKYFKKGEEIKKPDFQPGDQLSVEGSEDAAGHMMAANVYWERAATATTTTSSDKEKEKPNDNVADTWKDKPANDKPADSTTSTANAVPPTPPAPRDADDPGPPTLRHGKPSSVTAPPPVQASAPPPPPPPAQPTLVAQSSPAPKPAAQPKEVATNLPPNTVPLPSSTVALPPTGTGVQQPSASSAPVPNLVGLPPETLSRPRSSAATNGQPDDSDDQRPLGSRQEDPLVRRASDAALEFTETLPNYVCQEVVSRYESTSRPPSWHALDIVSTDLVYENGKENYRNITVNGKPTSKPLEETGAWSTGEFGSLLIDLFSPATDAEFHYRRDGRTSGVDAKIYDFQVKRENSHWDIHFGSQRYTPAFEGSTWIDPKTGRVLRIEIEAKGLPSGFPADHVESATDYQYVRLGDATQYLLPVHGEILSCERGTPNCSRNTIDFRNYHKYAGESSIQFGDVK
ncbi:MAG: hypothetical protein JO099_13425 [Acidobacteriia bacterium]|nr:hypothetical protein [Terriglobia bacterium]